MLEAYRSQHQISKLVYKLLNDYRTVAMSKVPQRLEFVYIQLIIYY